MKNYLVIYCAVIALLGVEVCTAQSLIVRAGLNLSNTYVNTLGIEHHLGQLDDINILTPKVGGSAGVLIDLPGASGVSFEGGVLLNTKGRDIEARDSDNRFYIRSDEQKLFVDIPLSLKYTTSGESTRFFGSVGCYVGVGVWGWQRFEMTILDTTLSSRFEDEYYVRDINWGNRFGDNSADGQNPKTNRFEYGSILSVGLETGSLVLSATYMRAWTSVYGHGGSNPHYVYSLAVGYKFSALTLFGKEE